jgi:hypothetical protein
MTLEDLLKSMPLHRLKGLHSACKTRGYAFFKDPKAVIALRNEIERRENPRATRVKMRRAA